MIAGAAGTVAVELAGRAFQGVGAALIAPSALTLLMMLFGAEPSELTKALAIYGAAAPAGGAAGVPRRRHHRVRQLAVVFYVNIPIALIALIGAPALMPAGAGRAPRSPSMWAR